jgi:Family of unknown function (DUF6314)
MSYYSTIPLSKNQSALMLQRIFSGKFSFHRYVSKPQITMKGTLFFVANAGGNIIYREAGLYGLEDKLQSFYQTRIYNLGETSLRIFKEDHSLLHLFILSERPVLPLKLTHTHECVNDQYLVTMNFYSMNNFSTSYQIIGPSKNYTIHTDYERI